MSHVWKRAVLVLLLSGASCSEADREFAPQTLEELLRYAIAIEMLESRGAFGADLPEDTFEPGSDAFVGQVDLVGDPIGTRGGFELGTTDTVISRCDDVVVTPQSPSQTIPVEIVELQLRSSSPITVTSNGGQDPTQWDVFVGLDPSKPSTGRVSVDLDDETSGSWSGDVELNTLLRFEEGTNTVVLPQTFDLTLSGSFDSNDSTDDAAFKKTVAKLDPGSLKSARFEGPGLQVDCQNAGIDPHRPGPTSVSPAAHIDPNVASLGRGCEIGAANIALGVVIGPGAFISDGATILGGTCIGEGSFIGPGVFIGPDCWVGDFCTLQDGCRMEAGSGVGDGALLGTGALIGKNSVCGTHLNMGANAFLGEDTQVGNDVTIADSIHVPNVGIISDGLVLDFVPLIDEPFLPCLDATGALTVEQPSNCGDDKTVIGTFPRSGKPANPPEPDEEDDPEPEPEPLGFRDQLIADIGCDIASPKHGGTGRPYVPDTHDCDDFAEELRQKLEGLGYNAMLCSYIERNKARKWYNIFTPYWKTGHVVTVVRGPRGGLVFIEPQAKGDIALDAPNLPRDYDGDGKIRWSRDPGSSLTDGCFRIELYSSFVGGALRGVDWD